ncbi:Subtilase family protein [Micromonospora viridifaciens]|uniref:Subtilase family protein n=1 Tax=Micromonospora viridifaciens TaxID=1881 RepID=A0A1C4YGU2_MICVI|nr:S8 family serine peptidase [Micromonospora viridifaciens]SCF19937.1 Subtilase family protein [Micromonospora viridifaciens]
MTEFVDVALTDEVRLPYVPGAESALADIEPAFAAAWEALAAVFPGIRLDPLFDSLPVEEIQAMVDAARERSGEEPPDLLAWFTIPVDDESLADAVAAAVAELPFVAVASRRPGVAPCAVPLWGSSTQGAQELQVLPPPRGVDAVWAWHVPGGTAPGVRIADIEHGWDLTHEELRGSRVTPTSVFGSAFVEHGTSVAGVVVGADDGVGVVGIAPGAELLLVTDDRGSGSNTAAAVLAAAAAVGVDGIILLEIGAIFGPPAVGAVPVELDPAVQRAIRLVALFGITVIEPAGNGAVDLDSFPAFAHFNPLSPTFVDSRAVVVGAGQPAGEQSEVWERASFSSFGARVDCFGPGLFVRAPATAPDTYADFAGTSAASAVLAGIAAVIQGMSVADSGQALDVACMRRVLSDPDLGTAIPLDRQGGIGPMPDLRKIALARGWPRIVPPTLTAVSGNSLIAAFLNTENRLVRREWQFFLGWSDLEPIPATNFTRGVSTGRPLLTVRQEQQPLGRLVTDAFMVGLSGIEHIWWDDLDQMGSLQRIADTDHVAQGTVPAVATTGEKEVAVASVTPDGQLLAMVGDAGAHFSGGLTAGVPLDPGNAYRRLRNPAICSRADGTADAVAIDDGGTFRWFTGVTMATIGTGWQPGVADTSGVALDGGAGVTVVVVGPDNARALVALAVGRDGFLRAIDVDPAQGVVTSIFLVGTGAVAAEAPLALGIAGDSLVALAVNTTGTLLAATRPIAGGPWSDQVQVNPDTTVMPSGGVVAASLDVGVFALVVDIKGTVISTQSRDGVDWLPYEDVSE